MAWGDGGMMALMGFVDNKNKIWPALSFKASSKHSAARLAGANVRLTTADSHMSFNLGCSSPSRSS